MSRTLLIGGFAVVALAAAAGVATARPPIEPAPQAAPNAPVSRTDFVERRVQPLAAADADGDGTVTREERRARAMVVRQERAGARFERLDTDNDGKLNREEFVAMAERGAARSRPEHARRDHGPRGERGPVRIADVRARADQAFTRLDTDSDGFLSVEERRAGRERGRERMQQHRAAREASPQDPASE